MNSSVKSDESPIAAEGGMTTPPRADEDPYRTLDDLMAVVEALCPVWPPRNSFRPGGRMLL